MATKYLRWAVAACVILAGAAGGAFAISGAYASDSNGAERYGSGVAANVYGSTAAALTDEDIRDRLTAVGYMQVRSLAHEDGCIEAKGLDKDGKRFEIYVRPTTGEIIGQR